MTFSTRIYLVYHCNAKHVKMLYYWADTLMVRIAFESRTKSKTTLCQVTFCYDNRYSSVTKETMYNILGAFFYRYDITSVTTRKNIIATKSVDIRPEELRR